MARILKRRVRRRHEVITGAYAFWMGVTFYDIETRFELITITYIIDMVVRAARAFRSRYANYASTRKSYKTLLAMK
jgi:hypothetical protein